MIDNLQELFPSGQELLSKEHPARQVGESFMSGAGQMVTKENALNTASRQKLPDSMNVMKEAGYGALLYPAVLMAGEVGSKLIPVPFVGGLVGRAVGAEVTGLFYDHVLRRFDKQLPALEGKDYLFGAVVGDPMMASAFRQTAEGFQALSNPDVLSHAQISTTFKP